MPLALKASRSPCSVYSVKMYVLAIPRLFVSSFLSEPVLLSDPFYLHKVFCESQTNIRKPKQMKQDNDRIKMQPKPK